MQRIPSLESQNELEVFADLQGSIGGSKGSHNAGNSIKESLSIIELNVEDHRLGSIETCKTAKEAWDILKNDLHERIPWEKNAASAIAAFLQDEFG